jgi:N-terminal TM domain of oligopeptide transport permease C
VAPGFVSWSDMDTEMQSVVVSGTGLPGAGAAAPLAAAAVSPARRAWLRFRRNRLGYWSLVAFCVMVVLSLGAELISNDRPLVVRYEGQTYWPLWNDYSEKTFGGDFETAADYLDPYIRDRLSQGGNWALYTLNPYGPQALNYFASLPNPAPPSRENLLGTDDRGRDLLAQLIYGFRVSVLFALALTASGVVLGVVTGAIQGFFGGRTDLAFQRFIEIWGSMPELYLQRGAGAQRLAAAGAAVAVRLDGAVGLCAGRIPAQPPARLREVGACAGRGQWRADLAPSAAQQHDARGHLFAVSHECSHPGADFA